MTPTSGAFWGGYSGGPCPGIDSNGQIIFSYGTHTLSQTVNINQALSAAGVGIRLDGYNYSWWTKNSNINDTQPGSHDLYSHINVNLLDAAGATLVSDFYPYGYRLADWTRFSGSRTYSDPYSLADAYSLTVSVSGRDGGFWAGYYGPEYRDFNVSLKYSVDPCVADPLYSPSCAGYAQALLASLPAPETMIETAPTVTSEPVQDTAVIAGQLVSPAMAGAGQITSDVAPATATAESQSSSSPRASLATILNILGSEQARIATVERSTVESAVEQSVREADRVTQQAETLAGAAVSDSISVGISSSQSQIANDRDTVQSLGSGLNFLSAISASLSRSDSNMGFSAGSANVQDSSINQLDDRPESAVSFGAFSAVDIVRGSTPQTGTESTAPENTVSTRPTIPNNQLAGDITVASLGSAPQGFDAYMTSMPDTAFYAARDIYKGQRNVDNQRLLRGLTGGSDRLHQQMVDQQYGDSK